jgi:predicted secreted Zn-dependent protease
MQTTLLVFTLLLGMLSPKQEKNMIAWKKDYKLSWKDFKARPDPASSFAAQTSYSIQYSMSSNESGLRYHVSCSFDMSRSWGRNRTPDILAHEQAHFDIGEIFARRIRRDFKSYVYNQRTVKQDLRDIYQKHIKECHQWQRQYDQETDHSKITATQEQWYKKIATELEALKAFE